MVDGDRRDQTIETIGSGESEIIDGNRERVEIAIDHIEGKRDSQIVGNLDDGIRES